MGEGVRQRGVTPSSDFEDVGPTRHRDTLVGEQLGEYVVEARLGEGAMGIVYRAVQPLIGRQVAIKLLKPGFDDGGELLAEARAVSSARHPNIIDVFGFGETAQGQKYFVMELLDGEALDLWLRQHSTLTPLEAVGILKQLLSGLAAAHAANVLHRDLKPGNLFMASLSDGTHFLKILDFGLAKRVDPSAPEHTLGRMAGTPLYMAPEQTRGQLTGPFTDLYAVGCIAFELLMGEPPFSSPSLAEVLLAHQSALPPPLPSSVPTLLAELVRSLLEKEPARRPASALAARQVLERVERRLLAASGTNTAHQVQGAAPVAPAPEAVRASGPPRAVRARIPAPASDAAEDDPTRLAAPAPARRPSDPRRSGRDARPAELRQSRPPPTEGTSGEARPTIPAREMSPAAQRPTRSESLGASRFGGAEGEELNEASETSTAHDMRPFAPPRRGAWRWWPLLLLPLLAMVGALVLRSALAPDPVVEATERAPEVEPVAGDGEQGVPPSTTAPDEARAEPVGPPTPLAGHAADDPPTARVPVAVPAPSRGPRAGVGAGSVQVRLMALEERCLRELADSRQRMALEELRGLREDLAAAAPEEAARLLSSFEAQWLKGAQR